MRKKTKKVNQQLEATDFKIIEFTQGSQEISFDKEEQTVDVPIEISEENRRGKNSLADYESDLWKIFGKMTECGFGELYYEAVDCKE